MQTSSYFLIFNGENARIDNKKQTYLIFLSNLRIWGLSDGFWVTKGGWGWVRRMEAGGWVLVESPDLGISDGF